MLELTISINLVKEYKTLYNALQKNTTPVMALGLSSIHKAQMAAALASEMGRPVLVITEDDTAAQRLTTDITTFAEQEVVRVPARELMMAGGVEGVSRLYEQARIAALSHLPTAKIAVASIASVVQCTLPPAMLAQASITLAVGMEITLSDLLVQLVTAGYVRSVQVEGAGQFAVRGGIVDIFPPQTAAPRRVEFWGEEIDSISIFDVGSQRRTAGETQLTCLPCMETLPDLMQGKIAGLCRALEAAKKTRKKKHPQLVDNLSADIEHLQANGTLPAIDKYLPLIYPQSATVLDYLPANTLILLDDTPKLRNVMQGYTDRLHLDLETLAERGECVQAPATYALDFDDFCARLQGNATKTQPAQPKRTTLRLDPFLNSIPALAPAELLNITALQMPPFGQSMQTIVDDLGGYLENKHAVVVCCRNELRRKNLLDFLEDAELPAYISDKIPTAGKIHLQCNSLSAGFSYSESNLVVLTEGTGAETRKRGKHKKSNRDHVKSFTDLTPGDLVVHEHYGIGRFVGVERMKIEGAERDFVKIAFAGTDFLYVPTTSLDLIAKYIGAGGDPEKVKLTKLGGAEWTKARAKAKAATKELAEGLIRLYAQRARLKGHPFPQDDVWQSEFEQAFPYDETDDQLRCIAEIKQDMQSDKPMDRLLCGDVGFGKTEVALRTVMKCILAGKQAAILAPTTVLARQHYLTALSRFAGYPLKIELLSRYKTGAEQKKILEQLATGMIDLVIGTHKLFRKDLKFHDLGLLVVDEEQRFGVVHKEQLKEMTSSVDVLTLSATPIPRTLNMALSGIRDMSALEEPPHDRHPVQTFVLEYNEPLLNDAIRHELTRGGQVFYLHNSVESIDRVASHLQEQFPDHVVGVGHGKMAQKELAGVMTAMSAGELDILVCTTIIETGIDIPNANTLIIENADQLGLSQLHQLRGRVGRSSRRAQAYLTYRRGKQLTEIAEKRLFAIREFAEFGSGFKIAMRDLEIRGAGNVLGPEQSGHMMKVGYDLYLKLLEEAVLEEKGETVVKPTECAADLVVSANLSADYIEDAGQRVDLYRRIAMIRNQAGRSDLLDELIDRYGEPPAPAVALLDIALLRAQANAQGITEIKQREGRLQLVWQTADFVRLSAMCALPEYRGRLLLNAGNIPYLSLRLNKGEQALAMAQTLVTCYARTGGDIS